MNDDLKTPSTQVLVKPKKKIQKPKLFKVILLNDDYTPMEYVVKLLKAVFNKTESDAVNIMLMIHNKGSGVCGIFTKDVAETKVFTVLKMAKHDQHPLKCIMEPE
jgi:ATP-dependent Clp protease adaptor protein ClpS